MEQFRRLTRELRETKKTAEEALKKAEAKNAVEGATGTKRQRAEEEDKGGSSSSTPYSNRVEVKKNQGEEDHRGKGSKKVKDVDLREQIEKIVKGYKPQTLAELALEAARGIRKSPFTEDILKTKNLPRDDDALMCKLFPSSLSGSSLTWFRQLKPRSIGSFTELCEAFISQYVCNRRPRKDITILFNTKQNVGESLKSYMTRFTKEISTLAECDSHTASLAFREGALPGTKMRRSLIETPPLNMREVMARANGIIRLEEEEFIQSKQSTATIVTSPAGTTTKDLSGVNPLLSSLHVKGDVPGCLLTSPHCMINKVALYSNLRLKSKAEEYKPRDDDRIKIGWAETQSRSEI
ncbi:unnamed protein product [Malus baccata var. baccata]